MRVNFEFLKFIVDRIFNLFATLNTVTRAIWMHLSWCFQQKPVISWLLEVWKLGKPYFPCWSLLLSTTIEYLMITEWQKMKVVLSQNPVNSFDYWCDGVTWYCNIGTHSLPDMFILSPWVCGSWMHISSRPPMHILQILNIFSHNIPHMLMLCL